MKTHWTGHRRGAALAVALLFAAGGASAQAPMGPTAPEIAARGMVNHGTPACASCHGFNGEGEQAQNAPRLAGLSSDYLARQLHAFQKGGVEGGRNSQRMSWAASRLTDDEITALADYYASLPPVGARGEPTGGDPVFGRQIANQGNWAEKVPPCASCHGGDGLGVNDLSPPIAGQRADYIERELWRFRRNERRDDPLGLMRGISARLTPREIKAVAAYYATLPAKPHAAPAKPAPVKTAPAKPRAGAARR